MASETVLRSSGVYTTILGALNQFQAFTDLKYKSMFETTLNNKYGILTGYNNGNPPELPALRYFGIGTQGYQNIDNKQSALPFPGDGRMMDLYRPLPIRCIPLQEEKNILTLEERKQYRLRTVHTYNGIDYACYYLKLIDFSDEISIVKKDADGKETEYDLVPDSWLSPIPPDINQLGGNINANLNRIIVRASGTCTVKHEEIMEAVKVIYNSELDYARISEIGYYTGCEVPVAYTPGGTDSDQLPIGENTVLTATQTEVPEAFFVQLAKGHCFRGSELFTEGSYITPKVTLEADICINGNDVVVSNN